MSPLTFSLPRGRPRRGSTRAAGPVLPTINKTEMDYIFRSHKKVQWPADKSTFSPSPADRGNHFHGHVDGDGGSARIGFINGSTSHAEGSAYVSDPRIASEMGTEVRASLGSCF